MRERNFVVHGRAQFILVVGALLCLGTALAADKYVCDVPQNDHGCDYRNDELQRAFDEANPGDLLYLQAGFIYQGSFIFQRGGASGDQPITVTTSRTDWLPGPYSRVTPSDLPNMPTLLTTGLNLAALSGNLDSQNRPPDHWHFVGISFRVATSEQFDNAIVHTAGMGVNGWTIAGEEQLPDGLIFDRVYVAGPLDDSLTIQSGIRINGKNSVLKNSFVHPIFCSGIECHGLVTQTHPGPMEVSNNFISAGSIPVFSGGTTPDYDGAVQKNLNMRFNYLYRPLKWWSNPGNPDRAYFLANGSKLTCTKNLMEFKGLDVAMIEYNVHENVWQDNFCMGQYTGFTATPRQNYWESPAAGGSWGGSLGMGNLTTNGTSFSWTQNPAQLAVGQNVCGIVNNVHDCRKIIDVNNAAKTGHVGQAFTFKVSDSPLWLWVSDDTPLMRNMTVQHSVFRNSAQGINLLARDKGTAVAGSDAGRIIGLTVRNNLFVNTLNALANSPAIRLYPQEHDFTVEPTIGGRDIAIEHNTFAWPNTAGNVLYFAADGVKNIAKIKNLSIQSNIFPDATVQSDGNIYALGGSGVSFNDWGIIDAFSTGNVLINDNYLRYVAAKSCKTSICANNLTVGQSVVYNAGTYRIAPGTALWKAGHDGADVGADYDSLPLIRNPKVTAGSQTALLEFDLNAPIADALNTQPCVLEVSQDENLRSMLGPYTPVNDQNPAFFRQATASSRPATQLFQVIMNGTHVQWPLGGTGTVVDDNGDTRDLRYTPGSRYWGRLMCYADTYWFDFRTTAQKSVSMTVNVPVNPPADATLALVQYDSSIALDNSFLTDAPALVETGSVKVPALSGQPLYVRVTYLNPSGVIDGSSQTQVVLPN